MQGIIPRLLFLVLLWATLTKTIFGESTTCYQDGAWTFCETEVDPFNQAIIEEMRDTQKKILEEQERANMEAEFYREYNSNE